MKMQTIGYSPKGFRKPPRWAYWAYAAMVDARDYFLSEGIGGFTILTPWSVNGPDTWGELAVRFPPLVWNGFNLCKDAMEHVAQRHPICDRGKMFWLFYFHPPLTNPQEFVYEDRPYRVQTNGNPEGMGGMVGNENWGCNYTRPGTGIMGDIMAWTMCGLPLSRLYAAGWPAETNWTEIPRIYAARMIVHEIGHMAGLAHPDSDDGSPMSHPEWNDRHFTDEQKGVLRAFLA